MLSYYCPGGRLVFTGLALVVGVSRIVLGAHYPADVLTGGVVGRLVATFSRILFAKAAGLLGRVLRTPRMLEPR